ncbi:hypothetical protein MMC30_008610 [Trapelia coarctata]|nr:hypothetical protein [Trapelia coarctata]
MAAPSNQGPMYITLPAHSGRSRNPPVRYPHSMVELRAAPADYHAMMMWERKDLYSRDQVEQVWAHLNQDWRPRHVLGSRVYRIKQQMALHGHDQCWVAEAAIYTGPPVVPGVYRSDGAAPLIPTRNGSTAAVAQAAPQFVFQPRITTPQFAGPHFSAPQFAAYQFAAPQFPAYQFAVPQFATYQFAAPYSAPQAPFAAPSTAATTAVLNPAPVFSAGPPAFTTPAPNLTLKTAVTSVQSMTTTPAPAKIDPRLLVNDEEEDEDENDGMVG